MYTMHRILVDMRNNDPKLRAIRFDPNEMVANVQAISAALKVNRIVEFINLEHNNIGNAGAQAIAEALTVDTTIVRSIELDYNLIGNAGAKAIAAMLKVNTTLKEIYLSHNNIGDEGALAIAEALKINRTIQNIYLGNNHIGDIGAQAIAEALKINRTVEIFFLPNNNIADAGAQAIAETIKVNTIMQTIVLSYNNIGDIGAQAIAEALKYNTLIQTFNLVHNKVGDAGAQAIGDMLKVNTTINNIWLDYNNIGDVGVYAIAEALTVDTTIVRCIRLGYNNIGNAGAQAIAEMLKINTTINDIYMHNNRIGGAGAQAIAEVLKTNKTLKILYFAVNNIGNVGAKAIAEALQDNTSMQILYLEHNNIGDAGAQAIAEALKVNKLIETIYLTGNQIGDSGAQAIAEMLKVNTALQCIFLNQNRIGIAGVEAIAEALKVNTTLANIYLHDNNISTIGVQAIIKALKFNTVLQYASLSDIDSPKFNAILTRNHKIKSIFTSLSQFLEKDYIDSKVFKTNLAKLESLIPELITRIEDLPEYLVERYSVMQSLFYLSIGKPEETLYRLLQKSFHNLDLIMIAEKAMMLALFNLGHERFEETHERAFYQLIIYYSRKNLDSREFKFGCTGLQLLGKITSIENMSLLTEDWNGTAQILNYEEFLTIGQQALKNLPYEQTSEGLFLEALLTQHDYDALTVKFFWQSPAFRAALQERYPGCDSFRLLENYMLYPAIAVNQTGKLSINDPLNEDAEALLKTYYAVRTAERNSINIPISFNDFLTSAKDAIYAQIKESIEQQPPEPKSLLNSCSIM